MNKHMVLATANNLVETMSGVNSTTKKSGDDEVADCKSILIVEDEVVIRETLQLSLEIEGYKVSAVTNGKEAIELLQTMPKPCLILLDLMMPVMNGWEFIETIKKQVPPFNVPIVLVTAYGDQGKALKVEGVLPKPVDLGDLYKEVEKWCGKPGAPG